MDPRHDHTPSSIINQHSDFDPPFNPLLQSTLLLTPTISIFKTLFSSSTSSLIIIMLNPTNIARFTTSNLIQNSPFPSQDHRSPSVNEASSSRNPSTLLSHFKTETIDLLSEYWKKQIKRHMRCINKLRKGKHMKIVKKQLGLVLNLLKTNTFIRNKDVDKSSNISYRRQSPSLCTLLPPQKKKTSFCMVLSALPASFIKSNIYFELTVLGASGKIEYNAIFLKKWSEIQKIVCSLQDKYTVFSRFVQQKQHLLTIISSKQTELRNFILSYHDLDYSLSQTNLQEANSKEMKNEIQQSQKQRGEYLKNNFREALKIFRFLKREILSKIIKTSVFEGLMKGWSSYSLFYNLLLPVVELNEVPFDQQISCCFPSLETIISKFIQEKTDHSLDIDKVGNNHFPDSLVNAHLCLNCKQQRGYIACRSCSCSEGKTISLCLQCYQSYHKHLTRQCWPQKKDTLFEKWSGCDLKTTMFLDIKKQIPYYPSKFQIKSEQIE